jgi:NADH dehydrogenase (ubiquinone) 1 alpha subcomplex subunit 9
MDAAQVLFHSIGMLAFKRMVALPGPSTHTHEFLLELVSTLTYNTPSCAHVILECSSSGSLRSARTRSSGSTSTMPPSRPDDNDDHVNGDDEAIKTKVMTTAVTAKATTTQQQGDNNGTSPNNTATIAT